jgi:hypothetical protein
MNRVKTVTIDRLIKLALLLTLVINGASAFAMPTFARQYKQQFGYTPSCHACHQEGGGTPLNQYGKDFKNEGKNALTFQRIAALDSDKDGFANSLETSKKSNPGDAKSSPATPGNWLDLSSIIPKEVQVLFPQASAWKPLDAILTDKDIVRAEGMGVTLSAEDENTIYIPVANSRPIGTALIFPVEHLEETFFLLMATDRQLNISEVKPLSADQLPKGLDSTVLLDFAGKPIQSINAPTDKSLTSSIERAVKKAGALVYIRLKGA